MRLQLIFVVFFILLWDELVSATKEADRIAYLPGVWPAPQFGQYSGYLVGSTDNIRLHYWLTECETSPETAALIVWLNGGPGCSSMEGLLDENGPFRLTEHGGLMNNPHSWNKIGNVLYIESPAGVGFSYAVDGNVTTDDDSVSLNNYHALLNFMEAFPEYKGRDLFITGESYAGIYVPTLAVRLLDDTHIFNLKGIAVGNGLTSYLRNDNSLLYFLNYHGMIDPSVWNDLTTECCNAKMGTRCAFTKSLSEYCQELVYNATARATEGLNVYNIYSPCFGGVNNSLSSTLNLMESAMYDQHYIHDLGNLFRTNKYYMYRRYLMSHLYENRNVKLAIPCVDDVLISNYMNSPVVQHALHVVLNGSSRWELCSAQVFFQYKRIYDDLSQQYMKLLQSKVPILIYNGDIDSACNYLGDEWFVMDLQLNTTKSYEHWLYQAEDGTFQVGGSWKRVQLDTTQVIFATVRGAGHMVPKDKPIAALHLISNFINQRDL